MRNRDYVVKGLVSKQNRKIFFFEELLAQKSRAYGVQESVLVEENITKKSGLRRQPSLKGLQHDEARLFRCSILENTEYNDSTLI